jgi:uncharacterized phage protein (predicted DNA packaging)|nr:MAG TPA: head to tail adaptor [Caudoviricetes sp.]
MADITSNFVCGVRRYLRINHTRFDEEITDLIGAARADLLLGGIIASKVEDENDSLIKRAIVCYVKAEFGLDNTDAAKYHESYEMLKRHLMLSTEYTQEA